jgi:hypothetical protein
MTKGKRAEEVPVVRVDFKGARQSRDIEIISAAMAKQSPEVREAFHLVMREVNASNEAMIVGVEEVRRNLERIVRKRATKRKAQP